MINWVFVHKKENINKKNIFINNLITYYYIVLFYLLILHAHGSMYCVQVLQITPKTIDTSNMPKEDSSLYFRHIKITHVKYVKFPSPTIVTMRSHISRISDAQHI